MVLPQAGLESSAWTRGHIGTFHLQLRSRLGNPCTPVRLQKQKSWGEQPQVFSPNLPRARCSDLAECQTPGPALPMWRWDPTPRSSREGDPGVIIGKPPDDCGRPPGLQHQAVQTDEREPGAVTRPLPRTLWVAGSEAGLVFEGQSANERQALVS